MKKGVVIKIKQNSAIIMADDCMFYEVKVFNGMYKGMEICFSETDIIRNRIHLKGRRHINAASFILFVLCGYLFFNFYQENYAAYAYVGIDINPSIEISLNKKEQIIGVRGIDEEGEKIVSGLNINKMKGTEGVKEIIKKAIEENYLSPVSNNEITVYTIMEKNNDTIGNEIVNRIENAVAEEVSINSIKGEIKTLVSDKNVKKKADNKGVSVVEYLSEDSEAVMAEKSNKKNEKSSSNEKDENKKKNNIKKEDKKDRENDDDYDNDEEDDDLKKGKKEDNKKEKNKNSGSNKSSSIKDEDNKNKYEDDKDKNKDKNNEKIEKEENKNKNNHNKNNKIDENKNQDKYKEKIEKEKGKNKTKKK